MLLLVVIAKRVVNGIAAVKRRKWLVVRAVSVGANAEIRLTCSNTIQFTKNSVLGKYYNTLEQSKRKVLLLVKRCPEFDTT